MRNDQSTSLLQTLEQRFKKHLHRHPNTEWQIIEQVLVTDDTLLQVVMNMEDSGGEPDVFEYNDDLYFVDFAKETPQKRRGVCYDEEARLKRKKFPPESSAIAMAETLGITLLDENLYLAIQAIEDMDLKTSSWLLTSTNIRQKGGALFGDKRYGRTFIYPNGADSYYSVRGFRGFIKIK